MDYNPCGGWPWELQPAVYMAGKNFEVSDNDLWSTWAMLYAAPTTNRTANAKLPSPPGSLPPYPWTRNLSNFEFTSFGLIQRNVLWHGEDCQWFDRANHLIFEGNICTGNNPMAGGVSGNVVASYGGRSTNRLYIGGNTYRHTYGNNREAQTGDNFGSIYGGIFLGISEDGLNLTTPGGNFSVVGGLKKGSTDLNFGKAIVILNGTGAGQYRRVVGWSWDHTDGGTSWWLLNRPFAVRPDRDAIIQITAFRGELIFANNVYEDVGAVQTYGVSINTIWTGLTGERMGGFRNEGLGYSYKQNGMYHAAVQPSYYNQWIGISVPEALWPARRPENLGGRAGNFSGFWLGDRLQTSGYSFWTSPAKKCAETMAAGAAADEVASRAVYLNRFIVWKRCKVASNGGFLISHGSDLLLEDNVVNDSLAGFSFAMPDVLGSNFTNPPPFATLGNPETCQNCSVGTAAALIRGNVAHNVGTDLLQSVV